MIEEIALVWASATILVWIFAAAKHGYSTISELLILLAVITVLLPAFIVLVWMDIFNHNAYLRWVSKIFKK